MTKTIIAWLCLASLLGLIVAGIQVIISKVPTGQDQNASILIYNEVSAQLPGRGIGLDASKFKERPTRGGTVLVVEKILSEKEKESLQTLVQEVGRRHPDRKVILQFP
jgi:hypothetical protein